MPTVTSRIGDLNVALQDADNAKARSSGRLPRTFDARHPLCGLLQRRLSFGRSIQLRADNDFDIGSREICRSPICNQES